MAKNIPAKSVQRTPQKKESKKSRFTFVDGEIDYTFLVIVILIVGFVAVGNGTKHIFCYPIDGFGIEAGESKELF